MKKISPPKVNCFTLSNTRNLEPEIRLSTILDTTRGVLLSPKSAANVGVLATSDLLAGATGAVKVAGISCGRIGAWDGQQEILLLVPGVYEVEQLHGAISASAQFHDRKFKLGGSDGSKVRRGRTPATALLQIPWSPQDGHFHAATAIRIRRRGGEDVVGLSSAERLKNGWPILWRRTRREYDRVMSESARQLDHAFLRHGLPRHLLE